MAVLVRKRGEKNTERRRGTNLVYANCPCFLINPYPDIESLPDLGYTILNIHFCLVYKLLKSYGHIF
jgi:hypothetical protein